MEEFESLPEFQALVVAAAGKPERSMGDSIIPAQPPVWSDVRRQAQALAKTASNQLVLHIYLVQADTHVKGFGGFLDAMSALHGALSEQWDDLYPAPDLDDPEDRYYERVNLMNELSEQPTFLDALYRLPIVSVRGIGEFSARDIDISLGNVSASEEDTARCQEGLIRGAFNESATDDLVSLDQTLTKCLSIIRTIETTFSEKTQQSGVLLLENLHARVTTCHRRFSEFAEDKLSSVEPAVTESTGDATEDEQQAATTAPKPVVQTSLQNRDMVMGAFDAILSYYQTNEPSSPVRVLAFKAREFVDKPFFEVIQALAPAHTDNLPQLVVALQNQPLSALLLDSYQKYLQGEQLPDVGASLPVGSDSSGEPGQEGNNTLVQVIASRDDVLQMLQDIEMFFVKHEPASPIPMVISDIRRLVPKGFVELMAEFARLLPVDAETS